MNLEQSVPCGSSGVFPAVQVLFSLLLAGLLVSCGERPAADTSTPPAATNSQPTTAAASKPQFEKLKGKWLRPDGDYVVDIRGVGPDGKLDAAYFNPQPINVSKAVAVEDGAATKVFIELRDANYPGCTYSLTYDTKNDQLFGTYYQASMEQTFDVAFDRLKE